MRSIDSYYNLERGEFVQVIDFRTGGVKTLTWEKYHEVCNLNYIKRLPFRSELVNERKLRKDYLDLHEINKPFGMNFWEFLVEERLKDDFCEYEAKHYQKALLKWFEEHKVFTSLSANIFLQD